MRDARGFVLVNALILVAALASVAVFLLSKSETARSRRMVDGDAAQLRLYLDGFEALGLTLLNSDQRSGEMDHTGEAWAQAEYDVPVDRGQIAGSFRDLQGLFNVNWLSNPDDIGAFEAFERLVKALGLPMSRAQEIADFVTPGRALSSAVSNRRTPLVAPVGGPVLLIQQLRLGSSLSSRDFALLSPHITALPADSQLNVNTASPEVLLSVTGAKNMAALSRLIQTRARNPFSSVEDFQNRVVEVVGAAAAADLDTSRLSTNSSWFRADIVAQLGSQDVRRQTVFERLPLPRGTRVAYRLDERQ